MVCGAMLQCGSYLCGDLAVKLVILHENAELAGLQYGVVGTISRRTGTSRPGEICRKRALYVLTLGSGNIYLH